MTSAAMRVAAKIASLRKDQGMSVRRLADIAGIHAAELTSIEQGGLRNFEHIRRIATALCVPLSEICDTGRSVEHTRALHAVNLSVKALYD